MGLLSVIIKAERKGRKLFEKGKKKLKKKK